MEFAGINFCILDAARMLQEIENAQSLNSEYECLYRGASKVALSQVAPYIFNCSNQDAFLTWLAEHGWGQAWGIYFCSTQNADKVYNHFRKFLLVHTELEEELYFRFYDPRVLRTFLSTCDEAQLEVFFGPVSCFVMEHEDPSQALVFSIQEGKLQTEKILVEVFLASKPQPSE